MNRKYRNILLFCVSLCLVIIMFQLKKREKNNSIETFMDKYKKKHTINNTIALVFYGRKPQASILLRYLVKNLKINGGVLDKIVFAVKTNNKIDIDYLNGVLNQNKTYYERIDYPPGSNYKHLYSKLHDNDLIFKIDDDIVFISNGTFERMLEEYFRQNLLFLSANVVNHPLLSYVHARSRAILPFIEIKNYTWVKSANSSEIDDTIAFGSNYDAHSKWWENPKLAAIAHYSLLHRVENNNLDIYDFGIWDFHAVAYTRWSINFVLMRGKDVNKMAIQFQNTTEDEVVISEELPRLHKKHCYALGSAIVSHFSYFIQYKYLIETDVLKKYDELSARYLIN